jgi:ribosomal protein S18 acetylase RimI-like enzyme
VKIEVDATFHRARIANVHPLDNPVWHALGDAHRELAQGDAHARRYLPEVAPFAALPDDPTPDDWAALAGLVPAHGHEPGEPVALFRRTIDPPDGWETLARLGAIQMLAPPELGESEPDDSFRFEPLAARDVDDMLALAERTRPGPFRPRTFELGGYIGLRDADGELIAMAGERMRVSGLTEISAVCTDNAHRSRGIAAALVHAVARGIRARGDAPFRHVSSDNATGIRLYERLEFTTRATLDVAVLRRRPG